MGSLRKSKSDRATTLRPGKRVATGRLLRRASTRTPEAVPQISPGVHNAIETQRGVLMTVITLLHCLHIVLEHREGSVVEEPNRCTEAAIEWVSLPEMTAMILERTHSVISALDSLNLEKASKAFKP
jgi:hypothetical protein